MQEAAVPFGQIAELATDTNLHQWGWLLNAPAKVRETYPLLDDGHFYVTPLVTQAQLFNRTAYVPPPSP